MKNLIKLSKIGLSITMMCIVVSAEPKLKVWEGGKPTCRLVLPDKDESAARMARSTLAYHLRRFYNMELPVARDFDEPGTYIVLGTPDNNSSLDKLVRGGASLTTRDIGDEGFQVRSYERASSRYLIVYGRTPQALKHASQELVFYHLPATAAEASVDWPLATVMKPEFPYRGIYLTPCWSPRDSMESWQRVLRFNSEITLNRNWFWLDGFPVAGHTGIYAGTSLSDARNIQSLIDLANQEGMKFYIGGGWMNLHHKKEVGDDIKKGISYYLDYLQVFKGFHGFYLEPTGESGESESWQTEVNGLCELIRTVLLRRSDFEFAVAIGKFNNPTYRKLMAELDPKRVYWWWCWGDPIEDNALDQFTSTLRWHITMAWWEHHGSPEPPRLSERQLTGVVTTYEEDVGFGNPWNGDAGRSDLRYIMPEPRNFDPYTVPYFYIQYYYRERCWNLNLSDEEFARRMQYRLFDADAPSDAGVHYCQLSKMALGAGLHYGRLSPPVLEWNPGGYAKPVLEQLEPIQAFLDTVRGRRMTPRMADTLTRMDEALKQLIILAQKTKK